MEKTGLLLMDVLCLLWGAENPKSYCTIQAVQFLSSEQYFGAKLQGSPEVGFECLCVTIECQALQSLVW